MNLAVIRENNGVLRYAINKKIGALEAHPGGFYKNYKVVDLVRVVVNAFNGTTRWFVHIGERSIPSEGFGSAASH